ncbi:histidinol dehydrogenase [Candidatus Bathyarchaeota archaeon]|nr:histidinol dehydrogenase [Candidatus Bathyarchaeota archaeon]
MTRLKPVKLKTLSQDDLKKLRRRGLCNLKDIRKTVMEIVENVKSRGDIALIEYTRLYDGVELNPENLRILREEMDAAYNTLDDPILEAMEFIRSMVEKVCLGFLPENRLIEPERGLRIHVLWKPINSIGVYIPGGANPYPSTIFMTVTLAKTVRVGRVVVCTPPRNVKPVVLAAMKIAGVDEAFRVGGAQAIAAMAYGTETIPKVDKIVGPGSPYVEIAKRIVYGDVGVDLPAGPSEILILADDSADPMLVAVDLLSQAEHPYSSAILISMSEKLALKVSEILDSMVDSNTFESFERGGLFVADNLEEAIEFVNYYAPEHLEIMLEEPEEVLRMVKNTGSVFIGPLTPVSLGDYATGVSHVLPTGGAARFSSGLNPLHFMKDLIVQIVDVNGFKTLKKFAEVMANIEGLRMHYNALKVRDSLNGLQFKHSPP